MYSGEMMCFRSPALLSQSLNKQKYSSYFISLPGTAVTKEQERRREGKKRKTKANMLLLARRGYVFGPGPRRSRSGEVGWEPGSPPRTRPVPEGPRPAPPAPPPPPPRSLRFFLFLGSSIPRLKSTSVIEKVGPCAAVRLAVIKTRGGVCYGSVCVCGGVGLVWETVKCGGRSWSRGPGPVLGGVCVYVCVWRRRRALGRLCEACLDARPGGGSC